MILRLATPADAPAVAAVYAPYVIDTAISFEAEPPDAAEMGERITGTLARYPWLVADDAGAIRGYAYGGVHSGRAAYRWSVDVSVYVDRAAHRAGTGRRLYRALFALLEAQGYARAFAGITQPNAPSSGLHAALGFTLVGTYRDVGFKHGRWHDVAWWERDLRGPTADPAEPLALPDLDPALVDRILTAT